MKAASIKSENKKRKKEEIQEPISEGPKKAKVHAQRKFAQGAALNNSVITPLKDKVRSSSSTPGSGLMLTTKCPNTEDFLTFLCFRRTSILPPKLDFFKDAVGCDQKLMPTNSQKSHSEHFSGAKKQINKKSEKNDHKKKAQPATVQALRKKYHQQRLAKQKVSNVNKLAQKVKGKNMIRTRSSAFVEDAKPTSKKQVGHKENKASLSGLRSGLKRVEPVINKLHKKLAHLRTGLRSGEPKNKCTEKPAVKVKVGTIRKRQKDMKNTIIEVPEVATKMKTKVKLKKTEGFSDFSSDDNEPLLAVKKLNVGTKKSMRGLVDSKKEGKKSVINTRLPTNESNLNNTSVRPTRKTKEAAALYMEMITRKLVSPDKSGDDDISSVDSFPELPNAKRNEQRESEIKAKALANKKKEAKQSDEKAKEHTRPITKKMEISKSSLKMGKEEVTKNHKKEVKSLKDTNKKVTQVVKKEAKNVTKQDDTSAPDKKVSKTSTAKEGTVKPKKLSTEFDKKAQLIPNLRSSARSKNHEPETVPKKKFVNTLSTKMTKRSPANEKRMTESILLPVKKPKGRPAKISHKEEVEETMTKESTEKKEKEEIDVERETKKEYETKTEVESSTEKKENKEKQEKGKEVSSAGKEKQLGIKTKVKFDEKEINVKKPKLSAKKLEKDSKLSIKDNIVNRRPVRKCSAADKICFEVDSFTSDEDDFNNVFAVIKTNASTKKSSVGSEKEKPKKMAAGKKPSTASIVGKSENQKGGTNEKKIIKKDSKKIENKNCKSENEAKLDEKFGKLSAVTTVYSSSKKKENMDVKAHRSEAPDRKIKETNADIIDTIQTLKPVNVSQEEEKFDQKKGAENEKSESVKSLKESSTSLKEKDENSSSENIKVKGENLKYEKSKSFTVKETEAKDVIKEDLKKSQKKSVKSRRETSRNLRDRGNHENRLEEAISPSKRTRPVRQCSTGEKKWIETDSDSFSFYETSDDEDNLAILEFTSNNKSESVKEDTKMKWSDQETEKDRKDEMKESKTSKNKAKDSSNDNFSESDEEPLKKKAFVSKVIDPAKPETRGMSTEELNVKSQTKTQRDVPDLHPLKKTSSTSTETESRINSPSMRQQPELDVPTISIPETNEANTLPFDFNKFNERSEGDGVRIQATKDKKSTEITSHCFVEQRRNPVVPNRIEMILHSLKKDKFSEGSGSCSNDIKVTFGGLPYQPMVHQSESTQIPCNYQLKPIIPFPQPREPISTHGLDLLSEVALPKEKFSTQTERIEKWLKDSLAAEHKRTFPIYEDLEYKTAGKNTIRKSGSEKSESKLFFGKPVPATSNVSSHLESHKFGHVEVEAQKLRKNNVCSGEIRPDGSRVDQQMAPPKKVLTSVQDLLKLQKERKEMGKSPAGNSPHLKNCKCNYCVVKKGWFKNKPIPKGEHSKYSSAEGCEESAKPFQSLTKAFTKISSERESSKISLSVAPLVVPASPGAQKSGAKSNKEASEKKGIFQQKKLSFLDRMKERERKETAATKPKPNAFSPSNESSVYAFEPEPEQSITGNIPFRSKTRESRASSTSKSDDDALKICDDESSTTVSSGTQVDKPAVENRGTKISQSTSIAVQVNLDSETVVETETFSEFQDGKSIEISTQTEVPEEDSDTPMFYIPLQQATGSGGPGSADRQLIQGVALKLDTEGPMGPNQRVVMKAKLVTKPPDTPSIKAVVMPQPKRLFDQKNSNPPIGTVQPTTRKPPDEPKSKDITEPPPSPKDVSTSAEPTSLASTDSGVGSEVLTPKPLSSTSRTSSKTKDKTKEQTIVKDRSLEVNDDHSACSSASSSKPKRTPKQKSSDAAIQPSNNTPSPGPGSKMVEAPIFYASEKDFQDPFEFFDRIRPAAEKFGLCRIVPPSNFKPDCKVSDDMRFTAYNQYVHRMFHRWGPNIKEMMAIKKYLATQSISLKQPPWIGGIEVDLPRLYQCVQNCGGLMKVMEKKKWHHVADMMRIPKAAQDRVTKLDDIYCKYLLPYDTLSPEERQNLFEEVEKDWSERQIVSSESPDNQGEEDAEEDNYIDECEECVIKGRNMALNQFYRIARNTMAMWFKNADPTPRDVENEFWKHVSERNHHVCVHSGSIDSSGWGYGFPIAKNNSFSKHPWNLKVLTNNSGSVLRSLGPVMGVTVPTLHVGMVFTAFCWYRDPHGLPWIEYLHTGAPKIWYGISDNNSTVFQEALTKLLPRYIKNQTIWLPSDTAMIPPGLLVENGVSLCHTVQEPGQFILVFPRAFISSICTGYLVSESVYFAQPSWLTTAQQAFKDIQESCEPSMFSLEKLLFSIAIDSRSSVEVLKQILPMIWHVRQKEFDERKTLFNLGLKTSERLPSKESGGKKRKGRWVQEDDGDYECETCRTNLFISLVTNSHEEGSYCLPHAIELLTHKRHQLKYCKLMYTYTQEEMNELVEKLEQRIESKSQKKPQTKTSTSTK